MREQRPATLDLVGYLTALDGVETSLHLALRAAIRARNVAELMPGHAPPYLERAAQAHALVAEAHRLLRGLPGNR